MIVTSADIRSPFLPISNDVQGLYNVDIMLVSPDGFVSLQLLLSVPVLHTTK